MFYVIQTTHFHYSTLVVFTFYPSTCLPPVLQFFQISELDKGRYGADGEGNSPYTGDTNPPFIGCEFL